MRYIGILGVVGLLAFSGVEVQGAESQEMAIPSIEVTRYLTPELATGYRLTCEATQNAKERNCLAVRTVNGKPEWSESLRWERAEDIVRRFFARIPSRWVREDSVNERALNVEEEGEIRGVTAQIVWKVRMGNRASLGAFDLKDIQGSKVDVERDVAFEALHALEREIPGSKK